MKGAGGSATGRLAELTCLCSACRSRVAFGNVVISTPGIYLEKICFFFFTVSGRRVRNQCREGGALSQTSFGNLITDWIASAGIDRKQPDKTKGHGHVRFLEPR